jgi:hypothetical protein
MNRFCRFAAIIFFILLYLAASSAQEQEPGYHFVFLPPGIHFAPLKANIEEARIGIYKFTDRSAMKVDLGNSIDVLELENTSEKIKMTVGIDFFAYALTDAYAGFRLQIDALDGLFGGNLSVSKEFENSRLLSRLRILHHSAHYADGHYNPLTYSWIDNRYPSAFTRDFGELVLAYETRFSLGDMKLYGGYSHATLVRPIILGRDECIGGGEWWNDKILPQLLDKPVNLYIAYQATLLSTPAYCGANQIQLGCKFGNWNEKGPTFYIAYYTGPEMYGQYVDQRIEGLGVGFTMDFF